MSKEQLQQRRAEMLSALNQMLEQRKALDAQIGWHQGGIMMLEELLQGVDTKEDPQSAAGLRATESLVLAQT